MQVFVLALPVVAYVALISLGLRIATAIFALRSPSRLVSTSLDIATVWFIPASLFLSGKTIASGNYAFVYHGVIPPPPWYVTCLTALALLSTALVAILAFCILARHRIAPPPSPPPPRT